MSHPVEILGAMRAIIYTRVSHDQAAGRSVAEQEAECRRHCEAQGWDIGEVLCDNDIGASRHSRKRRPAYQQLLQVLQPGDILVTWEASRAQRDLAAYVQLRDLCAQRGVRWCYSGKLYDLSSGDDRFTTGLDALLAEKEAEQTRERVLRAKRAAAAAGRPAGRPPYGYRQVRDTVTGRTLTWEPDPGKAPHIVTAVRRLLAGDQPAQVARDLGWSTQKLRAQVVSPSYAGLRVHQGEVLGKACWPPLITEDEHRRIVGYFSGRVLWAHRAGGGARHLLPGIAACGVCGGRMRHFNPPSNRGAARLACEARSCVVRRMDLVDLLVTETLLARLQAIDPADLAVPDPADAASAAAAEVAQLQERLDAFIEQAADGALSAAALAKIEARLQPQIRDARRRAAPVSAPWLSVSGPQARSLWEEADLADRRELVRQCMRVTILPSSVGTRRFSPDDVRIDWIL